MERFDILITNWNRLHYLKMTFASLFESGAVKDAERIIIVDNGSNEEGVIPFLLELQKLWGVFLVLLPHNRGWGTAVNEGIGLSRAPYVLVSNNDVIYMTPDFHNKMLDILKRPFVLPAGRNEKGIGILGVWAHKAHSFVGIQNDFFREMDNVPAIGWMMPKRAMQEVGMLNENGPCFTKGGNGEDTTYVGRMKQAGWLVGVPNNDLSKHIDGY